MNMHRQTANLLGLLILCIIFAGLALLLHPKQKERIAKVYMLNVGQGDSFFIEAVNGKQLLIDGGRDATVLSELSKVMPVGDRSIDVVIATHPDADHIGGLPYVLSRYQVGLFLTADVHTNSDVYRLLYETLREKKISSFYAKSGMSISLDTVLPTNFKILFPDRDTSTWETNTASVVGRLSVGNRSALFTGDSPTSIESHLAKTVPKDIDVDILKLGHHGSKTSTSELFLKTTTPALALISAGVDNSYGHPHQEVLSRLKALSISFVSTQDSDTVQLFTNGEKWQVKK